MLAGMQIDDSHFRNRLLATQVLSTKDHTAWNVDIIIELLEGPLLNPKRLDEAMRASKFMRRLLGFFHPFAYRYTEVKRTKVSLCFSSRCRRAKQRQAFADFLTRTGYRQIHSVRMYPRQHARGQP